MRPKGFFKWTSLTIITLLVVGGLVLFTQDLGFLRGTLEGQVREATGRDFSIDENLSIRLGSELVIQAQGLRLANPEWAAGENFIRIGHLNAVLDPWSLWKGPLVIKRLELGDVDVSLLQNASGQANWQLTPQGPVAADSSAELSFLIENIALTDANIRFQSPRLDQPLQAGIETMEQRLERDGRIHIRLAGQLNGRPVRIEATGGPYAQLLSGDDISLEGSASFGRIRVSGHASFDNIWTPERPVMDLQIAGPDFKELTSMLGISGLGGGDLSLNAVTELTDNGMALRVAGTLGQIVIDFSSEMPSIAKIANASSQARISGPNFGRIARLAGLDGWPEQAFELSTSVLKPDEALHIEQFELSLANASIGMSGTIPAFPDMSGAELELQISGPDISQFQDVLGLQGLAAGPFSVTGVVSTTADRHTMVDLQYKTPLASGRISGTLGSGEGLLGSDLNITAKGSDANTLGELVGIPGLKSGPWSLGMALMLNDPAFYKFEQANFSTDGLKVAFEGRLGTGETFRGTDLSLQVSGTNLGSIFDLPGEARLPDGPYTVNSRVQLDGGHLKIGQLKIRAGDFDFKLDAELPWPVDGSEGRFSLDIGGVNITRVLPELAGLTLDPGNYEIKASGNWADGLIIIQQGNFRIGELSLGIQGILDLPPNLSATDLHIEISSPDLAQLGTIDGARWGRLPLQMRTSFSGTASTFRMEQFQAQLGESSIQGALAVDFEPDVPVFDLSFTTSALNLKPFQTDPAEDEKNGDRGSAKDARLIPELDFPMAALTRAEGRFAIIADRVYLNNVTLENSVLTGEISDGSLVINELGTDGYAGRLLVTLTLEPQAGGNAKLAMTVKSRGLVFDFSRRSEQEKKALPAFDIDIQLDGTGKSLREVAGVLNGKITFSSPGGRLSNVRGENAKALLLAKLVSAISSNAARQDVINISCFAAAIDVREGLLHLKPGIALQSDKLNIYAGGKINLGSEKIDVNFRTKTRKTIDISVSEVFSPYVKLSGTLAKPSVALDPKGTLLSGGAAYLSGGLSILAKKALDKLGGTADPCAGILKSTPGNQVP